MSSDPTVIITLEADLALKASEIWPDGDAPAVITADAVRAAMEAAGPKLLVLEQWDLLDDLDVTVSTPNPHRSQDTALFPEHAPHPFETAKVWSR